MKNYFLTTGVVLALLCSCGGHLEENYISHDDGNKSMSPQKEEQYAPEESVSYGENEDEYYGEKSAAITDTTTISAITSVTADSPGKIVNSRQHLPVRSFAANISGQDSVRKFIRTADMRFQVKNIRSSTYAIENIVKHFNGFVTYTHLTAEENRKKTIRISKDSLLENLYYTAENTITFRVPAEHLDTVIRLIGTQIDYLDYRNIEASDITFDLLSNNMKKKRLAKYQQRLSKSVDEKGKKLGDIQGAENSLLEKAEQEDNAVLEQVKTMDKVAYSTVNLSLYEREKVFRTVIADDLNIEAYEPSFWSKAADSLYYGWNMLLELLLALLRIWFPLLVVIAGIYYLLKKLR